MPRNPEDQPATAPIAASAAHELRLFDFFGTVDLLARWTQYHDGIKDHEIADKSPLQRAIRNMGREQGADAATDRKADREPDQPAQRHAMAALAVIAHAGEAGRHHLREQRDALRNVLVLAQNENQQWHQNSAAGDSQKAGRDAANAAGEETAENVSRVHRR